MYVCRSITTLSESRGDLNHFQFSGPSALALSPSPYLNLRMTQRKIILNKYENGNYFKQNQMCVGYCCNVIVLMNVSRAKSKWANYFEKSNFPAIGYHSLCWALQVQSRTRRQSQEINGGGVWWGACWALPQICFNKSNLKPAIYFAAYLKQACTTWTGSLPGFSRSPKHGSYVVILAKD